MPFSGGAASSITNVSVTNVSTVVGERDAQRLGPVIGADAVAAYSQTAQGGFKQYLIAGGARPADWPIDEGWTQHSIVSGMLVQSRPKPYGPRLLRTWCGGNSFVLYSYADGTTQAVRFYVDGRPVESEAHVLPNGTTLTSLTFPDARPRLIEWFSDMSLVGIYTPNPYRCWKPQPSDAPRITVVGDSFVESVGPKPMNGIYQRMAPLLGVPELLTDGIGGSGFIAGGTPSTPYLSRLTEFTAQFDPDVHVVHGGGANDLNQGNSAANIINAAVAYMEAARDALPDTKLVFIEGFRTPAVFNNFTAAYQEIREGVRSRCQDVGVYYVQTNTPIPWIEGTGYAGATTGTGPSDVYIGTDGAHPNAAGNRYLAARMAPVLRRVMKDSGQLLNEVI